MKNAEEEDHTIGHVPVCGAQILGGGNLTMSDFANALVGSKTSILPCIVENMVQTERLTSKGNGQTWKEKESVVNALHRIWVKGDRVRE